MKRLDCYFLCNYWLCCVCLFVQVELSFYFVDQLRFYVNYIIIYHVSILFVHFLKLTTYHPETEGRGFSPVFLG